MAATAPRENGFGVWRVLFGYLGGAVAWALHLGIGYALVQVACLTGTAIGIHIVTLIALLITIAAGLVSYGIWQRSRGHESETGEGEWSWRRNSFLGLSGMLMNGLFVLAILYAGIPAFFLDPCHIR